MKKISLLTVVLGFLFLANNTAQAQDYKNGIGLRLGWDYGITFKHFLNERAALEGIVAYRNFGSYFNDYSYSYFRITGLYLIHNPISSAPGLTWYFGGGATFQAYSGDYFDDYATNESTTGIGIVGALGLEYKFANTPLTLSADWLPTFLISGFGNGFVGGQGGLAIRYTF